MTLIEVAIALAIAALLAGVAIGAVNSLTDADLRSTAVELSGAMKQSYDRAIMNRRTQRIAIDIDKGMWWFEYTESPFAVHREKDRGEVGEKSGTDEDDQIDVDRVTGKRTKRGKLAEKKSDVEKIIEGTAARFVPDADLTGGKPRPLPSKVRVSRVWTAHQEDGFTSGMAYIHFFKSGQAEAAIIELMDDGEDVISLEIQPLTGRVRSFHQRIPLPDAREDADQGRAEGDE
ncbi:MAG: hypothetical protein U1E65_05670 [Myxococcota bacterium]